MLYPNSALSGRESNSRSDVNPVYMSTNNDSSVLKSTFSLVNPDSIGSSRISEQLVTSKFGVTLNKSTFSLVNPDSIGSSSISEQFVTSKLPGLKNSTSLVNPVLMISSENTGSVSMIRLDVNP